MLTVFLSGKNAASMHICPYLINLYETILNNLNINSTAKNLFLFICLFILFYSFGMKGKDSYQISDLQMI